MNEDSVGSFNKKSLKVLCLCVSVSSADVRQAKRYSGRSRTTQWRMRKKCEETSSESNVEQPGQQCEDEDTTDIDEVWIDTYAGESSPESVSGSQNVYQTMVIKICTSVFLIFIPNNPFFRQCNFNNIFVIGGSWNYWWRGWWAAFWLLWLLE